MQMQQRVNQNFDLFKVVEDYFERILQSVPGIKSLVLDEETTGIISLICSQSQILKKDIYLIEKIEKPSEGKLNHLKSIYFIRPTEENFQYLQKELKDPRFSEYYLYFSNNATNKDIELLAEIDENDYIKSIQEVYADYYTINRDLFTLNIPSTFGLSKQKENWKSQEHMQLKRIFEGVIASLFSTRRIPMIKYLGRSDQCAQLADMLTLKLREEYNSNQSDFDRDSKCVMIITDRREDPVTPLLNQWTYQALLHELIGSINNRVDLAKGQQALNAQKADGNPEKEFVVSQHSDQFYDNNIYSVFGELAQNIKDFIDEVTQKKQQTMKIETLDDMQKAVDNIPELKKISGNLSKHVTLSCEITKLIEERSLMTISKAEQEISCKDDKKEHTKLVYEILNDVNIKNFEKLKTVILFALRYENNDQIGKMKDKLRECGLQQASINLINYTVDFAGKQQRSGDLFGTKDWMNQLKKQYKQAFEGVPNVFTQHQPYIVNLIEQLKTGKLKENEYITTNLNQFRGPPNEIIIFQMGGTTYEEAKEIGLMNKQGYNILLGGTYIHNSRTFLTEISQIQFEKDQFSINIDD